MKKETLAQLFSCKFCEIFKNTFFTEHLWTTASDNGEVERTPKLCLSEAFKLGSHVPVNVIDFLPFYEVKRSLMFRVRRIFIFLKQTEATKNKSKKNKTKAKQKQSLSGVLGLLGRFLKLSC